MNKPVWVQDGDDHVNNTPKQINLYKALNAPVPVFCHVAMILGDDGTKLSKRHGAVSVMQYREDGYLPEALVNYLVRLGWAHGDQEIFSVPEMIEYFSLDAISKSASSFNTKKLDWLNAHYMKTLPAEKVAAELVWHMQRQNIDVANGPDPKLVVKFYAERTHTLKEMAQKAACYYQDITEYDPAGVKKWMKAGSVEVLKAALETLEQLETWEPLPIDEALSALAKRLEIGMGKVGQPLRIAVTGSAMSPGIGDTMLLCGRERTLQRIRNAIAHFEPIVPKAVQA